MPVVLSSEERSLLSQALGSLCPDRPFSSLRSNSSDAHRILIAATLQVWPDFARGMTPERPSVVAAAVVQFIATSGDIDPGSYCGDLAPLPAGSVTVHGVTQQRHHHQHYGMSQPQRRHPGWPERTISERMTTMPITTSTSVCVEGTPVVRSGLGQFQPQEQVAFRPHPLVTAEKTPATPPAYPSLPRQSPTPRPQLSATDQTSSRSESLTSSTSDTAPSTSQSSINPEQARRFAIVTEDYNPKASQGTAIAITEGQKVEITNGPTENNWYHVSICHTSDERTYSTEDESPYDEHLATESEAEEVRGWVPGSYLDMQ